MVFIIIIIIILVKCLFNTRVLRTLFFFTYVSFCIVDGTSFMTKYENGTSVNETNGFTRQINKKLTHVICIINN
jgi:hypothetical protein